MKLSLGESHRVRISANEKWANREIDFAAGETYALKAEGEWRDLLTQEATRAA